MNQTLTLLGLFLFSSVGQLIDGPDLVLMKISKEEPLFFELYSESRSIFIYNMKALKIRHCIIDNKDIDLINNLIVNISGTKFTSVYETNTEKIIIVQNKPDIKSIIMDSNITDGYSEIGGYIKKIPSEGKCIDINENDETKITKIYDRLYYILSLPELTVYISWFSPFEYVLQNDVYGNLFDKKINKKISASMKCFLVSLHDNIVYRIEGAKKEVLLYREDSFCYIPDIISKDYYQLLEYLLIDNKYFDKEKDKEKICCPEIIRRSYRLKGDNKEEFLSSYFGCIDYENGSKILEDLYLIIFYNCQPISHPILRLYENVNIDEICDNVK